MLSSPPPSLFLLNSKASVIPSPRQISIEMDSEIALQEIFEGKKILSIMIGQRLQ